MSPRFTAQVDKNQAEIVAALRRCGAECQSIANVGRGVPDLLVAYKDKWFVAEVKSDRGKLNEKEQAWHDKFNKYAPVCVWHNIEEAIMDVISVSPQQGEE